MPIPYADLIAEVRRTNEASQLVQQHVFTGTPFLFEQNPADYDLLRSHLAQELGVPGDSITVVGSCRLGYSLNPTHPGSPVREDSDVDVIVADEALFDKLWGLLLSWRYPWHTRNWPPGERDWALFYLENFMAGHWAPHQLGRPKTGVAEYRRLLLQFRDRWFTAFKSTSRYPALAAREFKGRLYRNWEFAKRYHAYGLMLLSETTP